MAYRQIIERLAPSYDPGVIEAWMRVEHGTLDHLSPEQFAANPLRTDTRRGDPDFFTTRRLSIAKNSALVEAMRTYAVEHGLLDAARIEDEVEEAKRMAEIRANFRAHVLADVRSLAAGQGIPLDHLSDDQLFTGLKRVFAVAEAERKLAALTQEFADWQKAEGLDFGAPDSGVSAGRIAHLHAFDADRMTHGQLEWLRAFHARWTGAEAARE